MPTQPPAPIVLARTPWFSLAGILLVVGFTLASAAANLKPFHIPTARERQRAEQMQMMLNRRDRIAALTIEGDGCQREVARELARALVFDGRSAEPYANDFERRCGTDIVVRRWATTGDRLLARRRHTRKPVHP